MNKDDVIKQITSELLEEIKKSNKSFTNEEVKEKINKKLNIFFDGEKNKEDSLKADLEEDDQILNNEFTKIDNDEDLLMSSNFGVVEDSDSGDYDDVDDKKKVKKKFLQEIKDVYKNELENSISCFKNAIEVFKLTRKTSLFETMLIFVFLAIPTILAGCIAIIIVLILFLLWQLYLIINSILKLLEKAEVSIKGFNEMIKRKIRSFKSGSGFINRLIFSNALYSLMMFNGVMYMLINGLMLPLKSALDAEKIVANLLAKLEKGLTTVLKAPSELTLANTKTEAAKSRTVAEKQKDSKSKARSEKRKEKVVKKEKPIEKEKAQVRNQQKAEKQDEVSKALHQSRVEVANAIAKNLQAETSQQKTQDISDRVINLAERSDRQQAPMSSRLSLFPILDERSDMAGQILNDVLNAMKESVEKTVDGVKGSSHLTEHHQTARDSKDPALITEIQKIEEDYQRQLDDLDSKLADLKSAETKNPGELSKLQVQKDLVDENRQDFRRAVSDGEIQNVSDAKEVIMRNEANDSRQFVEQRVKDADDKEILLNVVKDAEDGKIDSKNMADLAFKRVIDNLESKGKSGEEIQDTLANLAPVIEGVVEEYRGAEQQQNNFKEEKSKQDGFVNRLETDREDRENFQTI